MRKIFLFMAVLLSMTMSAERITSVWSGSYSFPENDGYQSISSEHFTNLKLGDYLMLTVSGITNPDGWAQVNMAGTDPWKEVPGTNWNDIKVGQTLYQINDADLLASIKSGGLGVQGKYYTLTDVSIVDASNLKSVWNGNYNFPENDGYQEINASEFAYLQLGDYLLLTVSEITNPDGWAQIAMAGKDPWTNVPGANWNDIRAGKSLYQINDAAVLASIKSGGLALQGKYYTLTDVSIPSGATTAWSGSQVFDGNWSNNVQIAATAFAGMKQGYRLVLSVSGMTEGQCINIQDGSWNNFPHNMQYNFTAEDAEADSKVVEFELSPRELEIVLEKGIIVKGTSYTLSEVKVIPNVATLTTMYHDVAISAAGMATLMLPYYVPALPAGMKAYTLTVEGEYIAASEVTTIMPNEAVLLVADEGNYTLESAENVSDALSGMEANYTNGALVGTYQVGNVPVSASPVFNYVLQNGDDGVGFYKVATDGIAIDTYRAYLTCDYDNSAATSAPLRIVFRDQTATATENLSVEVETTKVLRDGQLYILHNNQLYTIQGQKIQ